MYFSLSKVAADAAVKPVMKAAADAAVKPV